MLALMTAEALIQSLFYHYILFLSLVPQCTCHQSSSVVLVYVKTIVNTLLVK